MLYKEYKKAVHKQTEQKTSQNSVTSPVQSQFQPRPFAVQAQAETTIQEVEKPELQSEEKKVQRSGINLMDILMAANNASAPPNIQPKLKIGEVGDQYEQEADRVAAKVVSQINKPIQKKLQRLPEAEVIQRREEFAAQHRLANKPIQRKLQRLPKAEVIQRREEFSSQHRASSLFKPFNIKSRDQSVQRKEAITGGTASADLESSIQSARGGGQSLDANLQQSMGQAMGADFSGVKVHTDPQSDQLNKSIQAKAFTTGQDVFFRQGAYEPGSRGGQELIAHELTHVMQQTGAIAQPKADPEKVSKKVAPSLQTGMSGRDPAIQRVPGLPNKEELRDLGLRPGIKMGTSVWERLENALDEYRDLGDADYGGQLSKLDEIKRFAETWLNKHTNPVNPQLAKKSKEQLKFEKIKELQDKIDLLKIKIQSLQRPAPPRPTTVPGGTPGAMQQTQGAMQQTQGVTPTVAQVPQTITIPSGAFFYKAENGQGDWIESPGYQSHVTLPIQSGSADGCVIYVGELGRIWYSTAQPETVTIPSGAFFHKAENGQGDWIESCSFYQNPTTYPIQSGSANASIINFPPIGRIWYSTAQPETVTIPSGAFFYKAENGQGDWIESPGYQGDETFPIQSGSADGCVINVGSLGRIWYSTAQPEKVTIPGEKFFYKAADGTGDWVEVQSYYTNARTYAIQSSASGGAVINYPIDPLTGNQIPTKIWIQQTQTATPPARWDQQPRRNPALLPEHQDTAEFVDAFKHSLFPKDGIKPEHVKQGALGNCFLMAALASIAKTDANYIRQIVQDGGGTTATVRLFEYVPVSSFEHKYVPHYIQVDKSIVKRKQGEAQYAQGDALWVHMIEKGYVAGNFGGNLTGDDHLLKPIGTEPSSSYAKVHAGGSSAHAFSVFTGKDAERQQTQDTAEDAILNKLQAALTANQAIAAGTRLLTSDEVSEGSGQSAGEAKKAGVVAGHAYSIVEVDVAGQRIKVRNPWGNYGLTETGTVDEGGTGEFWLPIATFKDRFSNISISGKSVDWVRE